jgi:hypothetical protein
MQFKWVGHVAIASGVALMCEFWIAACTNFDDNALRPLKGHVGNHCEPAASAGRPLIVRVCNQEIIITD